MGKAQPKAARDKSKRDKARELLQQHPEISSGELAEKMKAEGFSIDLSDTAKKKTWGVYVSQQRKAIGGSKGTAGTAGKPKQSGLDQTLQGQLLVGWFGKSDKAVEVLKLLRNTDVSEALKAVEAWKRLVDAIGEEAAKKAVAAMRGK